ncbi:MAG: glycoside hydrolase family 18 [Bacteroidales bacterium]|nr:glycoside hydrolase family 18 [Bacteroidales bacterium]
MKKSIIYSIAGLILGSFFVAGCSDWINPERVMVQHPDEQSPILRDNAYYEALREYKKTKHKIAFGWYGSWTAVGASYQTKLVSAPDSMDIISIWSQWHSLTKEQIADKEFVQKVKGTKVTYTIFLDDLPEQFQCEGWPNVSEEEQDKCIEAFAKAYCCDSIAKYDYDGLDIDYEPGYGASGPLVGHNNELFRRTIIAIGKYLGPKSGTGKLLMIDGVPYAVHTEIAEYFDYGIVQAYASSGYTDLQNRFNSAYNKGWKPEQYIFAENFESYWKNGGVTHLCTDGQRVNSLLGMARFNPTQGFGGGFGAYHMEYEYGHADMPYKYMRKAIQDANPAGGAINISLKSGKVSSYSVKLNEADTPESITDVMTASISRPAPVDCTFPVVYTPSLIEKYNVENGTEYKEVDASRISTGNLTIKADSFTSEDLEIKIDVRDMAEGSYLVPVTVQLPEDGFTTEDELVHYIVLNLAELNIDFSATEMKGIRIEPADSWRLKCYNGLNTSGWTGVWNNDSDAQQAAMFDGKTYDRTESPYYWYSMSSYFNPGNFIAELDKAYPIIGFRWHLYYGGTTDSFDISDIQISNDREKWESISLGVSFTPEANSDKWIEVNLKKAVTAKYFRVVCATKNRISMDEFELWTPAE